MKQPFFSIIVVCLNPGSKLGMTLDSICNQTFDDYEVLIKDGGSVDGTVEQVVTLARNDRIRFWSEEDEGIYDAMNQAVKRAKGEFIYFLNCGDWLMNDSVLEEVNKAIAGDESGGIFYGNIMKQKGEQVIYANPRLNRFACYRHLPCHQACFYRAGLLTERPFMLKYRIMADYEHFLACFLEKEVAAVYMPLVIAGYEGGGFSEIKANKRQRTLEHREIVGYYMSKGELCKYRLIMFLTFAPLRTALSQGRFTATVYNKVKKGIYWRRG
ncbi:MAG: glycosyltransferase [Lachnospiraceae bacterium]|jgi:glycosyltransferase involved in cell wall biosynthesis|nr:glycosyltransferase [Lachnospiraceae bacterium]